MPIIEFLKEANLITSEQVDEATFRLARWGGAIEDHLYATGAISETALLEIVGKLNDWKTVELSNKKISLSELEFISGQTAWDLKVLPLTYSTKDNIIEIACLDPDCNDLREKLSNKLFGKEFRLHYALRPLLEQAIIRHYRSSAIKSEHERLNVPDNYSNNSNPSCDANSPCALLFMPDDDLGLAELLASENWIVVVCQNIDEAKEEVRQRHPELILIKQGQDNDYREIAKQVARFCPSSNIRKFENYSDLFMPPRHSGEQKLLLTSNLQLAACAMATSLGKKPEDVVKVGPFVELLCRKLGLSNQAHMVTVCAGYLQDIARLYFRGNKNLDRQTMLFQLLTNTGDQFVYPPSVLNLIRLMYADLEHLPAERLADDDLVSANIVSAAEFFLNNFEIGNSLSVNSFENLLQQVKSRTGKFLLPEVAEALLQILDERTVANRHVSSRRLLLILDGLDLNKSGKFKLLETQGYDCAIAEDVDKFMLLYKKERPEFVVLAPGKNDNRILQTIESLMDQGITFKSIPAFVIVDVESTELTASLLKMGIQDVITGCESLEILLIRIRRILENREIESKLRLKVLQDNGTHGSLEHMNLIDLLQAIGVTEKSVRISITGHGQQLTIFLDRGHLTFAECDDKYGAEAIFDAIGWTNGIWSVDHIELGELPEPNNKRSIDSILIESVHYLDEKNIKSKPSEDSLDQFFSSAN